jgi:uncharacterized protein YndB with AHSA1/START domain
MADTYTVERSAVIDASADRIYRRIVDFHEWPAWSPWEDIDPAMDRTYSGAESGRGAVYEWSGNKKAGAGRMEIVDTTAPNRVVLDLRFDKPFKSRNDLTFALEPVEGGEQGPTRVTWTLVGPRTLMVKVMGIFTSMDKMVGKDFEKGLDRLRAASEQERA